MPNLPFIHLIAAIAIAMVGFSSAESEDQAYSARILPILERYCYDCHADGVKKGGVTLDSHRDMKTLFADRDLWERIRTQIDFRLMPPPDEDAPADAERGKLLSWIDHAIFPVDPDNPDPGHVTLRRLNRSEYRNTIRDLLGVGLDVDAILPPDDTGYGFDNIGDTLSLSPAHLERYFDAAEQALDLAITGPLDGPPPQKPETHRRIFGEGRGSAPDESTADYATRVIAAFAQRAFRRPVTDDEVRRFRDLALQRAGDDIESGIRDALLAVLVSPSYIYREEATASAIGGKSLVSEFALASRLSYFLWGSMPDERLLHLAAAGTLRENISSEITRMLASEKSSSLVSDFAGQWLQTRDLDIITPDAKLFPQFDRRLAEDMRAETEHLIDYIIRENMPVRTLIDADFTFINERLAAHYGYPDVSGVEFRKVPLASPRRGILGHASILTLTSYPTRTSPVIRGKYILDNILNTPPPPPPQNVPALETSREEGRNLPLREQLERHRSDPACSSCHALMDPLGFGLENFDALGRWRESENGHRIDPAGTLADGRAFTGPAELLEILRQDPQDRFLRAAASKMLTYALGRGLEYYDRPAIDRIVSCAKEDDGRIHSLIHAVIQSVPFQYRRNTP